MEPSTHDVHRIALAAGGTAGHVYPAIAVADELRRRDSRTEIVFIGGVAGREREIVAAAGYALEIIPGAPYYGGGWMSRLAALVALARGVLAARRLLRARRVDAVIGFGGYAAAGAVIAARSLGIWSAIVEGNAVAGKGNRLVGPLADRIYLGVRSAWADLRDGRLRRVGLPVRRAIVTAAGRRAGSVRDPVHVLVFGDTFLSARVPALLARVAARGTRVAVTHQDATAAPVDSSTVATQRVRHIEDVGSAYARSDLVVCRAGAGMLAEAAVHGVPALVVPLANAAEDHQTRNARIHEEAGAAVVVREDGWDEEALAERIHGIVRDPEAWRAMSAKARALAAPEATGALVDDVIAHGRRHAPIGETSRRRWGVALALVAILAGALALRVVPAWSNVFQADRVVLSSNDPWIFARQVDDLLAHFPRASHFDPYRLFPTGQASEAPLFPLMMATAAWALGGGAPSARLTDVVIAATPVVLGMLAIVPVFALGRRLFGMGAGLLAAAIAAVLPGQFLQRSLLGYSDHHVAEVLFSLLTLSALAAALEGDVMFALLGGLALGAYVLTWARGVLLVGLLVVWAIVQVWVEHGRSERRTPVALFCALLFVPALLLVAPVQRPAPSMMMDVPALLAGGAAISALSWLSQDFARRGWGRGRLAVACVVGGAALLGGASLLAPRLSAEVLANLARFRPSAESVMIAEARPLLAAHGALSLAPVWRELNTIAVLGLLGLVTLSRRIARERRPADLLLAVWTVTMLVATLGQARFAYYLGPTMALLAAAFTLHVLTKGLAPAFAAVAALAIAVYPSIAPALANAARTEGPSAAWVEALDWLRTSTPEPLGDPTAYRALYERPRDDRYAYPPSAYGVLAWSDYGYWITRLAHRIPVTNPTQHGATEVASCLTSTDPVEADRQLRALGARYIVLDDSLLPRLAEGSATWLGLLEAILRWGHRNPAQYYQVLQARGADGERHTTVVYLPEYYRMMVTRLYAFGGRAVAPRGTSWVVEVVPGERGGKKVDEIVSTRSFTGYAEASAFLKEHPAPRFRLVGRDPYVSCVPLDALPEYTVVHESSSGRRLADGRTLADIVVFEAHRP